LDSGVATQNSLLDVRISEKVNCIEIMGYRTPGVRESGDTRKGSARWCLPCKGNLAPGYVRFGT